MESACRCIWRLGSSYPTGWLDLHLLTLHPAPSSGLKWHSSPHEDQTLFTSSELPPYISEAYMAAHPPPPLHMLDRFDRTASDGGALRRYSDPYFFKREWALAELAQAEREKKAMKAKVRSQVKFQSFAERFLL